MVTLININFLTMKNQMIIHQQKKHHHQIKRRALIRQPDELNDHDLDQGMNIERT